MSHAPGDRQPGAYPAYPGSGESRPPNPPLTKRMRLIHWIALDCLVGGFLAICAAATIASHVDGQARIGIVLLFMAVVFIPVALRRRAPVTAFGALVILGVLLSRLAPAVPGVIFLAAAFVLYTVTVEGRKRTGAAALGLILVVMLLIAGAGIGKRSAPAPRPSSSRSARQRHRLDDGILRTAAAAVRGHAAASGGEQRRGRGTAADRARTA